MAERSLKQYTEFLSEISARTVGPIFELNFVIFFLVAVIGFGGLGVWIELIKYIRTPCIDTENLRSALIGFFPALVGSASLQAVWDDNESKEMRSLSILALSIAGVSAILLAVFSDSSNWSWMPFAIISSCFAFWFWWVVNANQDFLKQNGSLGPEDPLGDLAGANNLKRFRNNAHGD